MQLIFKVLRDRVLEDHLAQHRVLCSFDLVIADAALTTIFYIKTGI